MKALSPHNNATTNNSAKADTAINSISSYINTTTDTYDDNPGNPHSSDNSHNTLSVVAATGVEVRFTYLADQKKVVAYLSDPKDEEVLRLVRNEDLPKELRAINDPETLKSFLANAYAKVSTLNNGDVKLYINQRGLGGGKKEDAALLAAARDGKAEEVKALLNKGADIEAKDNNGRTALHLAAANEKVGTVDFLLSQKAATADARDNNGDTALHRAAYNGKLKSIELLINKGADISLKNNKEQTAFDLAKNNNKKDAANYLEARVAEQEKASASKKTEDKHTDDPREKEEDADKEIKTEHELSPIAQTTTSTSSSTLSTSTSTSVSASASSVLLPPLPSLTARLKALYKAQDTLPKLIEDASVPEQKMDDYYVKLQIVLKDKKSNGEEKHPIVLSQMFEQVEQQEAVGKVLVTGVAGIGKTSLLSHISYEWSKGKVFSDKFEYVLKVRLKSLLDEGLANELKNNYAKEDRLAAFIQSSIEQQQNEIKNSTGNTGTGTGSMSYSGGDNNNNNSPATLPQDRALAFSSFALDEIKNLDKAKTVLLLDGYDEVEHLSRGRYHVTRDLMSEIFKGYPNIVLTSRPNAVTSVMEGRLERKIEALGLEQEGVLQYIDRYFGKQAEWLSGEIMRVSEGSKGAERESSKSPIEDMGDLLKYYDSKQDDMVSKEVFASLEAIDSYIDRKENHDAKETVEGVKQAINSYYGELKESLLKVYHANPTLRDTLVTPINLAMICLISTDQEVLQEFKGDFNAGQMYEGVVYWLGKRYLSKFKKMAPEDIVKERIFNLDELSVLEQAAHDKFSINKVLIPGRDIDRLTHVIDPKLELDIRQVNKYGLLRPETSKTLHKLEIRLYSEPSNEELTNPQNENTLYLTYDRATNNLIYLVVDKNNPEGVKRKAVTITTSISQSPEQSQAQSQEIIQSSQYIHARQHSIIKSITKEKVKSIDKFPREDKEALLTFFKNQGYTIEETQTKSPTSEAKEAHDLINRDHRFIHLSFQEYLTAHSLKEQLASDNKTQVTQVAKFIAEHKNEPRYLMTLKFMAGIITNEKTDSQTPEEQQKAALLVTRFWEAVTCNLDGALELGLETKVTLLMHLIEQAKTKEGEIDTRIPNLEKIISLIDSTVLKDITRWGETIIASIYLSDSIATKILSIMKHKQRHTVTEQELKTSTEVMASLANKKEFGGKEEVFKLFSSIIISNDRQLQENWQLHKLTLEKVAQLVDKSSSKNILQELVDNIKLLTIDDNLYKYASFLLAKIADASPDLSNDIFNHFIQIVTDIKVHVSRDSLKDNLKKVVKAMPVEEALRALTTLLADKTAHSMISTTATDCLNEVVKAKPEATEVVLEAYTTVLTDEKARDHTKQAVIKCLSEVVKVRPEIAERAFKVLTALLADGKVDNDTGNWREMAKVRPEAVNVMQLFTALFTNEKVNDRVNSAAIDGVREVVKVMPVEVALKVYTSLLAYEKPNYWLKTAVANGLSEVVKTKPETAQEVFRVLIALLSEEDDEHADYLVKTAVTKCLIEVVKARPETAQEIFKTLTILLKYDVMPAITDGLIEVVKARPETAREILNALTVLLVDEKAGDAPKQLAANNLIEVVKARPETAQEVSKTLITLLADTKVHYEVKKAAANSLIEVVKARPETAQETLKAFTTLLADENVGYETKQAVADSLMEVAKTRPETAGAALNALTSLLADEKVHYEVKKAAANSLIEVVKARPETAEKVLKALITLLADAKGNYTIDEVVTKGLVEVVKARPETAQEACKTFTDLLADENVYYNSKTRAVEGLIEAAKARPKIAQWALKALIDLLADENTDYWVKKAEEIASSNQEIKRMHPEETSRKRIVFSIHLKAYEDLKLAVVNGWSKIVKVLPVEEALEAITVLLADESANGWIKKAAVDGFGEVVKARPETAQEAFKTFTDLLADEKVHYEVKKAAANSLIEVVKARPETAQETLKAFTTLLADKSADDDFKKAAASGFSEVAKVKPEMVQEVFKAFAILFTDKKTNEYDTMKVVADNVMKVVKAMPIEGALKALTDLFADEKVHGWVIIEAKKSLIEIVQVLPFDKIPNLLQHLVPGIRESVVEGAIAKLQDPKELAKADCRQIFILFEIIEICKGQEDETFKSLENATKHICRVMSQSIASNEEALAWFAMDENFSKFSNSPECLSFLKELYTQTLSDGIITSVEKDFIIKCIVEKGLTSTIMPEACKIIFGNTAYSIRGEVEGGVSEEAKVMLQSMADVVIERSENKDRVGNDARNDPLTEQYSNHSPMFMNTGSALPKAAADVEDVSIMDSTLRLQGSKWQMSVMHLSDHKQNFPSKVFVLLETRDYAGRHIIRKISLSDMESGQKDGTHQGKAGVSFTLEHRAFVPVGITAGDPVTSEARKAIFGEMKYEGSTKLRYYGSSYEISKADGEKLLAAARAEKIEVEGSNLSMDTSQYEAIRELLVGSNVFMDTDTVQSLLLPWNEYATGQNTLTFDTDKLLDLNKTERGLRRIESLRIDDNETHGMKFSEHAKQLSEHDRAIRGLRDEAEKGLSALNQKVESTQFSSKRVEREVKKNVSELTEAVNRILQDQNAKEKDLAIVVASIKKLQDAEDLNIDRVLDIYDKVDEIEQKLRGGGSEESKTYMVTEVRYDNPLLNHPGLFVATSKALGIDKAIELGRSVSPELIDRAAAIEGFELLLAGAAGLGYGDTGFA